MRRTRTAHSLRCVALARGVNPVSPTNSPRETVSAPVSLAGTRFGGCAGYSRIGTTVESQIVSGRAAVGAHADRTRLREGTAHDGR